MSALLSTSAGADILAPHGVLESGIDTVDWRAVEDDLGRDGFAVLPSLLSPKQCNTIAGYFFEEERFRSRIVMERYAFGRGEYKYFSYPLPDVVGRLRHALYPHLAPIANRWHTAMKISERFPATHDEFRQVCHAAGQQRPTPLLLRYQPNDYCCLHQDLYGDHVFPFQAIFLLNEPGRDFEGGELLLTESNPKQPGRADVVPLCQGDAVVLAVNYRPVRSARGYYRSNLRHGVSRLHSGLCSGSLFASHQAGAMMSEREIQPRMPWMAATSLSLLKPWLRRALMPMASVLARQGVTANQITVLSIVVSVALGACLAFVPGQPFLHALVPLWLAGRTVLASLDGTLAVCFGQKSRIGGFLNEAGDIASDIALYAPLALVSPFTASQVALVLALAVAGELVGVCSDWLGVGRRCEGPLGKADRAIAFAALNAWIAAQGALPDWAGILMPILAILAGLTLVNRLRFAACPLKVGSR